MINWNTRLLTPEMFNMVDYPCKPQAVFNPAAYVKAGLLYVYPRLIFDDRFYVSYVGKCEPINLEEACVETVDTEIFKYPMQNYEIKAVEDPRITEDGSRLLTVGITTDLRTQTIFTDLKTGEVKPFRSEGTIFDTGKDALFLTENVLFYRPQATPLVTYRAFYKITDEYVEIKDEDKLVVLPKQNGEQRRAFSTNAVRLSTNEHLVAFHTVLDRCGEYMMDFVIVDNEGIPQHQTNKTLRTKGIYRYGFRPYTFFGCGLSLWEDGVYVTGGVGDWAIVINSASLGSVLDEMREV